MILNVSRLEFNQGIWTYQHQHLNIYVYNSNDKKKCFYQHSPAPTELPSATAPFRKGEPSLGPP